MLTLPLFVALSVSGDISKIGKYDSVYCMYRNIFDEIWNTDMVIEYMKLHQMYYQFPNVQ